MDVLKNRLLQAMPRIQAVFDVVNPERIREQSSAVDAWLWQLRDAVEAAEDAIDELEYYELEEKAVNRKVSDWGSSFAQMKHKVVRSVKNVTFLDKTLKKFAHRDTVKRLTKAVEDLDKAAADVVSFLTLTDHLKGPASSSQQRVQPMDNDRETGSTLSATKFVGREKEREQIIGWLTNASAESPEIASVEWPEIGTSTNGIPIISVIGHGGMGKTTLAQSICQEDEILKHFTVIWVTVSTSFDATSVTSKILESATGAKPNSDHLEPLQNNLKQKLNSIDFLLVLDDVWEDKNREEWEKLFAPLRKMNTASKILLTTRMRSVADMATSVMRVERGQYLTLKGLEQEDNIELFNHHVYFGLDRQECVHLILIGEKIARKLGGCPLVTKVIGGHLQANMTIEYWCRFFHERLKHFKGTEEDIMRVLRLSYYYLPTELQICFRYCCIFPQDYAFEKKELVQMWMGSGLISQPASESQTFEDIGENTLVQLTRKSFFDLKSRDMHHGGKREYYVMHDLMHDLARNVSFGECARVSHPARFKDEKYTVRHLCIDNIHSFSVDEVKKIAHFQDLRTIIIDDSKPAADNDVVCALEEVVESLKSLRLIYSRLSNNLHFTEKCGNMKHLRYLRLYQISPEGMRGVVKLYHLMLLYCATDQVLQVRYLGNLDRLRYVSYGFVEFSGGRGGLGEFPIDRLYYLQELNNYRVTESTGNKLSAIKSIMNLRTLEISGLENVKNPEEANNAKLNEKRFLSSLSLSWPMFGRVQNKTHELVLNCLKPHGNVKELKISGYQGLKLPVWIEDISVKNLVSLKLYSCKNWESLSPLGELLLLRHIELVGFDKLQQIGHLLLPPRLETLEVRGCPELSELPVLPPSLLFLRISHVGLTKLPMIGNKFRQSCEIKPSQLLEIDVGNCSFLTSLKGSLLEQKMYVGALRTLKVRDCLNLEYGSMAFEEMNRLTKLHIRRCPKLSTMGNAKNKGLQQSCDMKLPLLGFTHLDELTLEGCSGLVSLPSAEVFMSLKSLRCMMISGCENISPLGGLGSLPSLLSLLSIQGCSKLAEVGSSLTPHASAGQDDHLLQIDALFIDLPSLLLVEPLKRLCHTRSLVLSGGSEMESLPERWLLQNRLSLECLAVSPAKSLKSLPLSMRDLSSLEKFTLGGAVKLRSIPDLPSSLQELCLRRCHSELEEKFRANGSSELNRMSHIPLLTIGSSFFIMGMECNKETYDRLK